MARVAVKQRRRGPSIAWSRFFYPTVRAKLHYPHEAALEVFPARRGTLHCAVGRRSRAACGPRYRYLGWGARFVLAAGRFPGRPSASLPCCRAINVGCCCQSSAICSRLLPGRFLSHWNARGSPSQRRPHVSQQRARACAIPCSPRFRTTCARRLRFWRAAGSTLAEHGAGFDSATRTSLARSIESTARKMSGLSQTFLDLTRFGRARSCAA